MARTITPVCKLCRREGEKLFLKGERCFSQKCAVTRRGYPPGQHGTARHRRPSEYGTQLREKQKVKRIYGVFERQFRRYFAEASRVSGITGDTLLQTLERRFDNVVYRAKLAPSRAAARQAVRHGHLMVNGSRLDIPSAAVAVGDTIGIAATKRASVIWEERVAKINPKEIPAWLTWNPTDTTVTVMSLPTAADVDQKLNLRLIVEHYSR